MIELAGPADGSAATGALRATVAAAGADFAAFYASEVRSVIGLAFVLSGSRVAAEDIAHDAFVAALRHWERIRDYDNAATWVRRVVVNRSISRARTRAAEARAMLRLGHERTILPELSADTARLWEAVRRLPRRQAQVLALHYWEGLNVAEIGELLEVSTATVKTHLQRGRLALAKTVAKE